MHMCLNYLEPVNGRLEFGVTFRIRIHIVLLFTALSIKTQRLEATHYTQENYFRLRKKIKAN